MTGPHVTVAYEIRAMVFVNEQGVPLELERDDRDQEADHFLARLDGTALGAARLVLEPAGFEGLPEDLGPIGHLGRLAVLPGARGMGFGAMLVRGVEQRADERGVRAVYLGAQTHAEGFYRGLGYTPFGPEFDDAGLPHRHMVRPL